MYLKSIELSGFKSFAKKSELKFTSPISAIVGPNGSGKSNIAEAFRFVLGEQSIKSLRGKKGEDLIFNGAGDLARVNRASVKVIFDNSFKFLPLDFEEVTIERVVHRDSVNEYFINGSLVRLRDVVELLATAHIGSSGHHIISQGEADRILNASVKERKSMIEDALGLKLYQYKKQESERKLEKTRENIEKVESLRREIAPHIKFLKKQVEKVEKAVELRIDLERHALEYCNHEQYYITTTKQHLHGERKPLEEDLAHLEAELISARNILEKNTHSDTTSHELIQLEKDLEGVREEKDNLFLECGRLDGEIASLVRMVRKQEEIARTHALKTVLLVSVEELSAHIETAIREAKNIGTLEALESALHTIEKLLGQFVDHNRDRVDSSLVADVTSDIEKIKESKVEIERTLEEIKEKENLLVKQYLLLKENIDKEKDADRDAEKSVFRLRAEEQEIRSRLRVLHSEEETLHIVEEDFKRELSELGALIGVHLLKFETLLYDYGETRVGQDTRRRTIEKIKIRLEESGGAGGAEVVKEYTEASERDAFLSKELTDLEVSASSLTDLIRDLDLRLSTEFKIGVEKINREFKNYFERMFGGGEAQLSVIVEQKRKKRDDDLKSLLENNGDEYEMQGDLSSSTLAKEESGEEGIDIEVSLPKKKVKGLIMLSGGERALTSIALLFAISQVNPPPFIILDETDAALDEANSKKYADMIENLSRYSQLIVITHNRETMSRAGILYGVTMGLGGGSKLLSIAFDEAVSVAK